MKCFLSGMPDLKLGLNDKIGLEKEAQAKARPSRRLVLYVGCGNGESYFHLKSCLAPVQTWSGSLVLSCQLMRNLAFNFFIESCIPQNK
jgi:hypothetical protein